MYTEEIILKLANFFVLFSETPLTVACSIKGGRCREMVLALVGGGAHLDFRNKKGMTALHKAVLAKNMMAVKVRMKEGTEKLKSSVIYVSPEITDIIANYFTLN